jgi:hypothetical protein
MRHPFKHPLATHTALDVLGRRRNGAPIYAIAGGSGEGEDGSGTDDTGNAGGTEDGADGGTDDAGSDDKGGKADGGTGKSAKDDGTDWKAHAREWEKRAKDNAAATKTAVAKALEDAETAAMQKVAKALGLVKDDEAEADPAKLMSRLQEQQGQLTAAQEQSIAAGIEATVLRTAYANGVDGDKLLDSRSFCDEVDGLDPSDPKKFQAALKGLITEAAKKDQRLALSGGAGKSGGDQGGSRERDAAKRPTSIGAAIRSTYNT